MKTTFATMMTLGLALAFAPRIKADTWDHKTIITVNQPIQVPGAILEPGKYVMKLQESLADRNTVRISSETGQVLATVLTIPSYRRKMSETPHFTFREVPKGQPLPLHTWFYPGDMKGHEFVYLDGLLSREAKSASVEKAGAALEVSPTRHQSGG